MSIRKNFIKSSLKNVHYTVIVYRFIEVNKIDISTVQYSEIMDGVYHFTDIELGEKFRKYH